MIDLIFFCFFLGVFVAGFYLGGQYKSMKEMFGALYKWVGSLFA